MALQVQPAAPTVNTCRPTISSFRLRPPVLISTIPAARPSLHFHASRRINWLLPIRTSLPVRCFSALSPELKTTLDKVVTSQKVILFMKGTRDFPQCGFSNTVVQILTSLNVPFETINILENEILRQGLKEYSSWPTFPQLYVDGEFFGGCDITVGLHNHRTVGHGYVFDLLDHFSEAYKSGELQELLEKASCS